MYVLHENYSGIAIKPTSPHLHVDTTPIERQERLSFCLGFFECLGLIRLAQTLNTTLLLEESNSGCYKYDNNHCGGCIDYLHGDLNHGSFLSQQSTSRCNRSRLRCLARMLYSENPTTTAAFRSKQRQMSMTDSVEDSVKPIKTVPSVSPGSYRTEQEIQ